MLKGEKMQVITSKENEMIKGIRKLKDKKYRDETNAYLIEGIKMIEEAIKEKVTISKIVICEECLQSENISQKLLYEIAKLDCIYVNKKVFEYLTTVVNPQGIMAVIEKNSKSAHKNTNQTIIPY